MRVDINCDMGESFGAYEIGADDDVLPHVTSANIACGFHGGDPTVMRKTVAAAAKLGVAVGAHPGLPDLAGFGRRAMQVTPDEVYDLLIYQIGALLGFAKAAGVPLRHVKPHGALYNMAARDRALAGAIAAAVRDFNPMLILAGLAGSTLIDAGLAAGLTVQREGFCDRRYRADGSLMPRSETGAVIEDIDDAVAQAVSIATRGEAVTGDGAKLRIEADTLCVHGDRANAAAFAERLRRALERAGMRVAAAERPA